MQILKSILLFGLSLYTFAKAEPNPDPYKYTTIITKYKTHTQTKQATVTVTPTNCHRPTSSVPPPACTTISRKRADYDDLKFIEIGDPNPIAAPGGGPYNSLVYNNFYVDQFDGSIQAATGNQWAMSYDYRIPRTISTDPAYPDRLFDLNSFYVACSAGVPQKACLIELVGYTPSWRVSGGAMVTRLITYPAIPSPVDPKDLKMMKVTLGPEWRDLEKLEFKKVTWDDGTGEGMQGLMIDALEYVVKSCPRGK